MLVPLAVLGAGDDVAAFAAADGFTAADGFAAAVPLEEAPALFVVRAVVAASEGFAAAGSVAFVASFVSLVAPLVAVSLVAVSFVAVPFVAGGAAAGSVGAACGTPRT